MPCSLVGSKFCFYLMKFYSQFFFFREIFVKKFVKTPLVLEKETHDFASKMFPPGFFVVHDATRGSHNDITEIKIRKYEFLLEKFREID